MARAFYRWRHYPIITLQRISYNTDFVFFSITLEQPTEEQPLFILVWREFQINVKTKIVID